ncbi:MAG: hypothetical protein QXH67_00765 [Candidatus Bathyarchaeia archaeon]
MLDPKGVERSWLRGFEGVGLVTGKAFRCIGGPYQGSGWMRSDGEPIAPTRL